MQYKVIRAYQKSKRLKNNYTSKQSPLIIYFLTLILIQFLSPSNMILKLVYGKEIHVYDLKAHQSLDHVRLKIKDLFKRVPTQFTLCYKNPQQVQIPLTTNEQFSILMDSIKNEIKIFKLFIKEQNKDFPKQTKSEHKIQTQNNQQFSEMTQVIHYSKDIDELSQRFTNLNEPHRENQSEPQAQQNDENSKTQPTTKQFQILGKEEATKVEENLSQRQQPNLSQRQQPSERQLNVNGEESSDPQDLRQSSSDHVAEKKQELSQKPVSQQNQESNAEKRSFSQQQQYLNEKSEFKQCEQKIDFLQPQSLGDMEQPMVDDHVQKNFSTHNVTCDICNSISICGARFMCVICKNYNLCQKCQVKYEHEHPLLKICYTFQTPIRIEVQIPQYRPKPTKQAKIIYENVNLQQLSASQRRERVLSISSQISQLLDRNLNECLAFVGQNQGYTKETLIQMLIEGKNHVNQIDIENRKKESKNGLQGFVNHFKGFIFGSQ